LDLNPVGDGDVKPQLRSCNRRVASPVHRGT
jgi:hypothetical protein